MASTNNATTHYQNATRLLFESGAPGACGISLSAGDVPAVDRNRAIGADH